MDEESHWDAWQRTIQGDEVDAMEVLRMAAMYERYFKEVQSQAARSSEVRGARGKRLPIQSGSPSRPPGRNGELAPKRARSSLNGSSTIRSWLGAEGGSARH